MVSKNGESANVIESLTLCALLVLPFLYRIYVNEKKFCNEENDENQQTSSSSTFPKGSFPFFQRILSAAKIRFEASSINCQSSSSPFECWKPISFDNTSVFAHQVAGHTTEVLRRFQGKVLKPMVKEYLFFRELTLYEQMAQSPFCDKYNNLPRAFVPEYSGVVMVQLNSEETNRHSKEAAARVKKNREVTFAPQEKDLPVGIYQLTQRVSNSILLYIMNKMSKISPFKPLSNDFRIALNIPDGCLPHIVLEDLTMNFHKPCVIDIKMGQQTYEPTASQIKKKREILKCPFQVDTGFRITGMKVYNIKTKCYSYTDKQFGRSLRPDQIADGLAVFFNNGFYLRNDVLISTIQQLEKILTWFESQKCLHFYCSSILIIYDGNVEIGNGDMLNTDDDDDEFTRYMKLPLHPSNSSNGSDLVKVKMIDFAHTLPSSGGIDTGYIIGLKNLISKLHIILDKKHEYQ